MKKLIAMLGAVVTAVTSAWAATPVAVWNAADFSSTQNGWSIDINGNSLDDTGACTIGTKPIKIVNKAIKGDTKTFLYYTVVMDVADVPTTETTGALVTFGRYPASSLYAGHANTDLIGAMLENGTPAGFWNGAKYDGGETTELPAETTRITVLYKSGGIGADNGVWAFANGNNKIFTSASGLRATMQVNQINIGGRSDNNTMILAGMKVKRIAIFADTTYAGDETMTTFDIPVGKLRVFTSVPSDAECAEFQDESWTGTVWLKGATWNDWDFGKLGNANSRVRLTGVTGYGPAVAVKNCEATVDLVNDGQTVALKQTNGYSTLADKVTVPSYNFSKLIGTGTLQAAPARATPQIRIVDTSDFNGSLNVAVMRVAIGEGTEPTVAAKVTIEEGATLAIAPGKSVNAVAGSGTLVLPDFTTSTDVRTSLKNADWTGTVEISKHVLTAQTQIFLADYGNANSKIVLKGMTGINSGAGRYLPNNCRIQSDVRIDDAVEFNQGSSGANYYFDGTVSGSGNLSFLNWRANDGFNAGYHIAKLQNYTGTLTTTRATTIDILDIPEGTASGAKVVAMSQATDATIRVTKITIDGEDAPEGSSITVQTDGLYYFATDSVAHIGDTDYPTLADAMTAAAQMEGNPVVELYKSVSEEVTIPANTTLVQGQQIKVIGAIHGTGTIRISGPEATGTANINTFLTSEQIADFAGTIHFASARIEVAANFIPTAVTIKVTDGAQFYMGGSAGEFKWGNKFVISGNGWAGESSNANLSHCAIRAEHPIADTATIECEVINDVVPSIGCAQTDLNVGATITGGAVKFVVFWGPHNLAVDPAKIQVTGNVTLVGVALNVATETAASLVSVIDGSIVKTGEGALTVGDATTASIKLNGGTIVTANDGLTVTTDVADSHVEYNEGAYAIVPDPAPTYPEDIEGGSDAQKAAYVTWAAEVGIADPTVSGVSEAFALKLTAEDITAAKSVEEAVENELDALLAQVDLSALSGEGGISAAVAALNEAYDNATFSLVEVPQSEIATTASLFRLTVSFLPADNSQE